MTNLSPGLPSWRRKITRERVLVGVPLLAGGLVAGLLTCLVVMPSVDRLESQQQRLEHLRKQQASINLLPGKLKTAAEQLAMVQQKQAVLVNLVAGKDKIQTFLAQLSRESMATGVVLELYEPVSVAPPSSSAAIDEKPPGSNQKSDQEEIDAKNPLAVRGYEKTAVIFKARGSFEGLQSFLRGIEALQLVVQPSNLELIALDPKQGEDGKAKGPALTQLKLTLTFYDKAASVPSREGEMRIIDPEEGLPPEA
ncbi:MAG: hypothetical protein QF862_05545 [Prochlorococcaceae cyanobacterium ETNP7_MAG_30]|nr:hypothetical protein [Prochlorococcaceae cyanobacterium ETNP7_MAG_30]